MGFPDWTLWGMGLSIAGALIAITLSWLGQSPKLLRRLGLASLRLDLRVRAFTGYALASLLLAIAFFLAGVPLSGSADGNASQEQQAEVASNPDPSPAAPGDSTGTETDPTPGGLSATPATPETGAFSGPPTVQDGSEASSAAAGEETSIGEETSVEIGSSSPVTTTTNAIATPEIADPTLGSTGTITPAPSATPPPTATTSPTETPVPTLTPTAIVGPTAVIESGGSTLWLKRSPGGQNTVLVRDGEVVLVLAGRANQNGILWREVATVDGVEGWLQQEFVVPSGS